MLEIISFNYFFKLKQSFSKGFWIVLVLFKFNSEKMERGARLKSHASLNVQLMIVKFIFFLQVQGFGSEFY